MPVGLINKETKQRLASKVACIKTFREPVVGGEGHVPIAVYPDRSGARQTFMPPAIPTTLPAASRNGQGMLEICLLSPRPAAVT